MPQIASGENTLMRRATAPINFPSTYTGLPLIPPATPVLSAFPPILARMMSCLGPHAFFHSPTISTGTGSGSDPSKTVQAIPFIPRFRSADFMISAFPAFGRSSAPAGSAGCSDLTVLTLVAFEAAIRVEVWPVASETDTARANASGNFIFVEYPTYHGVEGGDTSLILSTDMTYLELCRLHVYSTLLHERMPRR